MEMEAKEEKLGYIHAAFAIYICHTRFFVASSGSPHDWGIVVVPNCQDSYCQAMFYIDALVGEILDTIPGLTLSIMLDGMPR